MPPEERLVSLTLALEQALLEESWEEADDLFAARDAAYVTLKNPHAVPREVDEIDARILARLQGGQADIRRELLALNTNRRAAMAYGGKVALRDELRAA